MKKFRAAMRLLIAALLLCCVLPMSRAQAGIIATGDGTGNTTPPPDDPGWGNVGRLNGATGVYLGNNYVLTASHVGAGTINLNGSDYFQDTSVAATRLKDNSGADTDLLLFRLQSDPGLSYLNLSETSPILGSPLLYIGNGVNRAPQRETFTVTGGSVQGFRYAEGRSKRWGTNTLSGLEQDVNAGFGPVDSFYSNFSDPLNDPSATDYQVGDNPAHEVQAATGDSGGAVFLKRNGVWELAGITNAIGEYGGKTVGSALFGELTYNADLAVYRPQIVAVTGVPEPSTLALMSLGIGALAARRRKRDKGRPCDKGRQHEDTPVPI